MKVVILVPRRDDDGPRDALWDWCRAWWEREQSHMPVFEGYHTEGLFNRSAAVNRAARLAGDWDVAVIIDADVVCDPNRVKEAVELAHTSGSMVLPHNERLDLSEQASRLYRAGQVPDLSEHRARRRFVRRRYAEDNGHPSVSSVVVVPRRLWNEIGGFDETFRGWGYEDTAFAAAAETFGGIIRMPGEVIHFWHPTAREGKRGTEAWSRNSSRGQRYRAAIGDKAAIRALQAEGLPAPLASSGIPRILHRTVPATTDPTVEAYWAAFEGLHPDWTLMTHRDPLDPAEWPLTSSHWGDAANGAQLADMIRLEALLRWGGVYVDSDVEPLRSLEPLLPLQAFAAWEDARCVPNAVMGAVPGHPAVRACLDEMLSRIPGPTWDAGPGVLTEILPGRSDVLLLPPGSFYPYHYSAKDKVGGPDPRSENFLKTQPWAFVVHHWAGSWLKSA
jgi:hypothetical protein